MRKEQCPAIANPLVKINLPFCGFSGKIWCFVPNSYGHNQLSLKQAESM
jgi:hypothetical protein